MKKILVLAVFTALAFSCGVRTKVSPDPDSHVPAGYKLVWSDEFNQGTVPGPDWVHEVKPDHWVNRELQNYVDGAAPDGRRVTEIKDGSLRIHCFKGGGWKGLFRAGVCPSRHGMAVRVFRSADLSSFRQRYLAGILDDAGRPAWIPLAPVRGNRHHGRGRRGSR